MSADRIVLPAEVREYFAAIGRRGGQAGRRELTKERARLMVAIREAKRQAKKTRTVRPKLTRKQHQILRKPKRPARNKSIVSDLRCSKSGASILVQVPLVRGGGGVGALIELVGTAATMGQAVRCLGIDAPRPRSAPLPARLPV